MIKTIIIDDEPLAISVVQEYLSQHPEFKLLQECNNGFEGVKAIAQHKPDLIFLDIQMPKINGFEMLELIEEPPAVIFTTAFDEYAIKAFEAHAIDYLLKPFSKERFDKAIQKWKNNRSLTEVQSQTQSLIEDVTKQEEQNRVVVKNGANISIIPVSDINFFEAYDDYVKIHTADSCFLKKQTMSHFENVLNPAKFVRVHRSFIVQVQEITKIEPYGKDTLNAVLKSGKKIPLSKTGYAKLKESLGM